jgi:hypothetical protein
MLEYLYGKRFGSKIARANRKDGDRILVQKQVAEGNDRHGGHRHVCEGNRARVGMSHGMVEVKLLCFILIKYRIYVVFD